MTDQTETAPKEVGEKLAEIRSERFADDDGIWSLTEDEIEKIVEIADGFEWQDGEEPDRDAVLIEITALILQQRILYRGKNKKGPGSR